MGPQHWWPQSLRDAWYALNHWVVTQVNDPNNVRRIQEMRGIEEQAKALVGRVASGVQSGIESVLTQTPPVLPPTPPPVVSRLPVPFPVPQPDPAINESQGVGGWVHPVGKIPAEADLAKNLQAVLSTDETVTLQPPPSTPSATPAAGPNWMEQAILTPDLQRQNVRTVIQTAPPDTSGDADADLVAPAPIDRATPVATPVATSVATPVATGMAAMLAAAPKAKSDGKSLAGEDPAIQKMFWDVHGAQAGRVWADQHDRDVGIETAGAPTVTSDGQSLMTQPESVKGAYVEAHGADAAKVWARDHEAAIATTSGGTPPPAPNQTPGSGGQPPSGANGTGNGNGNGNGGPQGDGAEKPDTGNAAFDKALQLIFDQQRQMQEERDKQAAAERALKKAEFDATMRQQALRDQWTQFREMSEPGATFASRWARAPRGSEVTLDPVLGALVRGQAIVPGVSPIPGGEVTVRNTPYDWARSWDTAMQRMTPRTFQALSSGDLANLGVLGTAAGQDPLGMFEMFKKERPTASRLYGTATVY